MTVRRSRVIVGAVVVAALLAYLYDPPWIGGVTSGLRPWERDESGTVFRWTNGRASFFVPSSATTVTIPLRSGVPGPLMGEVPVEIRVDDRFLAAIVLTDARAWVRPELPLGTRPTRRRFRRIDLHTPRAFGEGVRGVMTGVPSVR